MYGNMQSRGAGVLWEPLNFGTDSGDGVTFLAYSTFFLSWKLITS